MSDATNNAESSPCFWCESLVVLESADPTCDKCKEEKRRRIKNILETKGDSNHDTVE